jgi:hypothetical protein
MYIWCVWRTPIVWPVTHSVHNIFNKSTSSITAAGAGFALGYNSTAQGAAGAAFMYNTIAQLAGNPNTASVSYTNSPSQVVYLTEAYYDGSSVLTFWMNGALVSTNTGALTTMTNTASLIIGGDGTNTRFFGGDLFEVGAYIPAPPVSVQKNVQLYSALRYGT